MPPQSLFDPVLLPVDDPTGRLFISLVGPQLTILVVICPLGTIALVTIYVKLVKPAQNKKSALCPPRIRPQLQKYQNQSSNIFETDLPLNDSHAFSSE